MIIGEIIRRERNKAGLTQEKLAKAAGIATISVRQYETGKRTPRIESLIKIAGALGIPASEFVLSAMDCGANKESGR